VKQIKAKYGAIFTSLDIEVGFAQFLRVLLAHEGANKINEDVLRAILPNTSTNESLRLYLQNLEVKA